MKQPNKSYFPMRVKYEDRVSDEIVRSPDEIRNGVALKVIETRVIIDEPKQASVQVHT